MVNNEIRDKFKKLYLEKFGIELTDEEATLMSTDLVNLVKVLLRNTHKPTSVLPVHNESPQNETFGIQHY